MRKIVISLLLASVAASPAFAGPRDREDRTDGQQTREERQQAREERRERQARPATPAAPATSGPREISRPQQSNDAAVQRRRQLDPAEAQAWRERRQQVVQSRQPDSADTLRQSDRPVPNVMRPRTRTPVVSDTPRPGTQPARRLEHRRTPEVRWSTNWRNDHRYDWRRWRDSNRSRFNVGVYYDPFGWGYQPYSDRLAAVAELLQQSLLDQRSLGVPPALRAPGIPLGSLLGRRAARRYLVRPGRRRDPQLLLVELHLLLIEEALRPSRSASSCNIRSARVACRQRLKAIIKCCTSFAR